MKKRNLIILIIFIIIITAFFFILINKDKGCEKNPNPVFTHDITDIEKIDYIVPPGNVEEYDTGNVLKTHSYIKGPNKVPIYAPMDSTLYQGVYVTEQGINQYALFFEVNCDVFYLFDHVVDVPEKIAEVFPNTPAQKTNTMNTKRVPVKAGEIIGYSIGPEFEQWDFGVYNKTKKNDLSNIDAPIYDRDKIADCPYNYFPENKKDFYYSKFQSHLTGVPIPTIFCQAN